MRWQGRRRRSPIVRSRYVLFDVRIQREGQIVHWPRLVEVLQDVVNLAFKRVRVQINLGVFRRQNETDDERYKTTCQCDQQLIGRRHVVHVTKRHHHNRHKYQEQNHVHELLCGLEQALVDGPRTAGGLDVADLLEQLAWYARYVLAVDEQHQVVDLPVQLAVNVLDRVLVRDVTRRPLERRVAQHRVHLVLALELVLDLEPVLALKVIAREVLKGRVALLLLA